MFSLPCLDLDRNTITNIFKNTNVDVNICTYIHIKASANIHVIICIDIDEYKEQDSSCGTKHIHSIYKFVKFRAFTINEMFQWIRMNPNLITVFISVSLFANAALFTIYINGHRDKTAKGIFVLTIIYAVIAMLFKYL